MIALPAFLPKFVTWKVLGVAVLALALAGGAYKVYQAGKNAGHGEGQRAQLKTDAQDVKRQTADVRTSLAEEREKEAEATGRLADAKAKLADAEERLLRLNERREQTRRQVDLLPQAEVMPELRRRLQLHPATDPSPLLYPDEARQVVRIVSDYDELRAAVKELEQKAKEHEIADRARDDKIASLERQRDVAVKYGDDMLVHYKRAYDAAQPRTSALKKVVTLNCFFRGCTKKFDLPDPITLKPKETP